MTKSLRLLLRGSAVFALWLAGIVMLVQGQSQVRRADPELRLRWDWSDDIVTDVIRLTLEVGILYALLRPHSYAYSWKRAVTAIAVFFPWMLANFIVSMHANAVYVHHLFWLGWVFVGCVGLAITSFAATHHIRFASLLALALVSCGVVAFLRWVEGTSPPAWMTPFIAASALIATTIVLVGVIHRQDPREAS